MELDDKVHELKLGRSFDHNAPVAFHSVRYDFKPASVDTTQKSIVEIGQGNSVTVSVPHVEGAGTTHTVYKGNKRPCQKECVLIIDHTTGEMTLEKLANTIQLKKTRQEGSSRVQQMARPVTPVEMHKHKGKKKMPKHAPPPPEPNQSQSSPPPKNKLLQNPHLADAEKEPYSPGDMLMSASSGDSGNSSSSDSDMDLDDNSASEKAPPPPPPPPVRPAPTNGIHSMLSEDLQLSESGSDSD